eukprot:TCALIF_11473-PA protein Name:"Protein of unknown function" AED:0.13 eAED:0.13 QI:0/1/0/1/0/0/2/0/142
MRINKIPQSAHMQGTEAIDGVCTYPNIEVALFLAESCHGQQPRYHGGYSVEPWDGPQQSSQSHSDREYGSTRPAYQHVPPPNHPHSYQSVPKSRASVFPQLLAQCVHDGHESGCHGEPVFCRQTGLPTIHSSLEVNGFSTCH